MWHSWILAVDLLGAISLISQNFLHFPPEPPKRPIVVIFFKRASLSTLITFNELPEVEIAINTSFLLARAWNGLLNTSEKS
mgnify:CR=1 FL=1